MPADLDGGMQVVDHGTYRQASPCRVDPRQNFGVRGPQPLAFGFSTGVHCVVVVVVVVVAGRRAPSPENLSSVLGVIGVTGDERADLLDLARRAADPNWVTPGVDKQLAALIEYERTAAVITEVNPLLVPGLLQTADYARAIMVRAGSSVGDADHRVTVRLGRRDVLERSAPAQTAALIGEHASRNPPCEAPITADQLRHLLKWGERDNITIRAVPVTAEWTPMHSGPFVLMEFSRVRPVVHLEHDRSAVTLTDGMDAQDVKAATDSIRQVAMTPHRTAELITRLADMMETTT